MMKTMYKVCLCIFVCVVAGHRASGQTVKEQWPKVSPLDATFAVSSQNPHVETIVFSEKGDPVYRLTCHEGDFENDRDGSFDFLFHCKLFPMNTKVEFRDLFWPSDNWRRSRTRAKFRSGFDGLCKDHPYYGQRRIFQLRGMRIELQVSDFSQTPSVQEQLTRDLDPNEYRLKLKLRVIAVPDPTATARIAGPAQEVCDVEYSVDGNGRLVQKKRVYADPARE